MTTKNGKSTLLSVRIPNELMDTLKGHLETEGISKSEFVVTALRTELGVKPDGKKRVGRPRKQRKKDRETKVIRVDKTLPDIQTLEDTLNVLKQWQVDSSEASPTSPRWQQLRKLLAEIDEILDTPDGVK